MASRKWPIHPDFERLEALRFDIEEKLNVYHSLDGYKNDTRTNERVQTPTRDSTLNVVQIRSDLRDQIRAMRDEKNALVSQIQQIIQLMDDRKARQALQVKYLFGQTFSSAAEFCHMETRSIYRVCERGMKQYFTLAAAREIGRTAPPMASDV
ncbi:MAG: hypothetical protein IKW00_00280 [Clostridia bacterium]|nr:hypothetical protein [Clostridia bacterium]